VHDGNGWTRCGRGHRHWGRHGAAGLLVSTAGADGHRLVLLQQRSWWGSYGGAWGPPGGARDSHESVVRAALREAAEECAIDPAAVSVHAVFCDDHGGWTYQTVLATSAEPVAVAPVSEETSEVAWVPASGVERLRLHPEFARQWPALRSALAPVSVIVDVANVMGSRPDGWWRDRAGAARALCEQIALLTDRGLAELPEHVRVPHMQRWFPQFIAVVEGVAARDAWAPVASGPAGAGQPQPRPAADSRHEGRLAVTPLRVARASGSGDDEIVSQVKARTRSAGTAGPVLVVTADRELRSRCQDGGASVTGPRWLLDLL
jgi:8-oxo-dGTP diphosphatase